MIQADDMGAHTVIEITVFTRTCVPHHTLQIVIGPQNFDVMGLR